MGQKQEPKIFLDFKKLSKWAETELRPVLRQHAEGIADDVRKSIGDSDVEVGVWSSSGGQGRPVEVVTIRHPSGLARQAKHGILTGAAAKRGLTIRRSRD